MGAFHLTNYPGLEFQKIHVANGTVFFRFSIIFEEQRKCRQVDPNSRRFHPGNFRSIRFCYLNFQNFRLNGLRRNSFRFCLLGENISGNFSPTRSLLVKCKWSIIRGKSSRSQQENMQQPQLTYGVHAGIWTRATSVGCECCHQCAPFAPPPPTPPPSTFPLHWLIKRDPLKPKLFPICE